VGLRPKKTPKIIATRGTKGGARTNYLVRLCLTLLRARRAAPATPARRQSALSLPSTALFFSRLLLTFSWLLLPAMSWVSLAPYWGSLGALLAPYCPTCLIGL